GSWRSRSPGTPAPAPCTPPRSSSLSGAAARARRGREGRGRSPGSRSSAGQIGELVLADLELVAVLEAVGLDPRAVDVGAVQRAEIVEVVVAAALDQQRVVARH